MVGSSCVEARRTVVRDSYHEQLEDINGDLVRMTSLVGSAMNRATQALLDADLKLAESVIEGDQTVDAMAAAVDEKCYEIAARQQPVATDLRIIMGGTRISGSVERMGDLAAHVAKRHQHKAIASAWIGFTASARGVLGPYEKKHEASPAEI